MAELAYKSVSELVMNKFRPEAKRVPYLKTKK